MRAKILFFLILGIGLLCLSSCMDNMEYTPRIAAFSDFYPIDETAGIEPFISLYWSCEFASYYELYFGTDADSLEILVGNMVLTEHVIEQLALGTTYYWKVTAYNGEEVPEYGPVLSFSTRDGEWGEFYPVNGADSLSVDVVFNWGMSKSDIGNLVNNELTGAEETGSREDPAIIYYDFYLGTAEDNLALISENSELQYYQSSGLLYDTEYFWQVRARNYISELAAGPVLSFSTRYADWQILYPENGADEQAVDLLLGWQVEGGILQSALFGEDSRKMAADRVVSGITFNVYLGEAADMLEEIADGIAESQYELTGLDYQQEYFWQIKAINDDNQELFSDIYHFSTKDRFSGFEPENYEIYVAIDPVLKWSCIDGESYDVYLGTDASALDLVANGLNDSTYALYDLEYETMYIWQIYANLADGSSWQGPELSFITIMDPVPPGYNLHNYMIRAEMPCNIDVVYRVTDRADNITTFLESDDFMFLEDGEEIDEVESALRIYTGSELNSLNTTVLMIDNSTSMDTLLSSIKLAAYEFVQNMEPNQVMCVYTFSEQAELIEDFTSNQANLIGAINSIQTGYSSTDMYGAIITGLHRWGDLYFPENLVKGNLIVITDGSDTQGSTTLQETLMERGNKQIYTLGIGSDIDIEALSALGNGGFYQLPTAANACEVFCIIQQEIVDYLNSFYWLNYITPKRGDVEHTIEISVINNPNTSSTAIISGTFNSTGFYGTVPGVYVNIDPDNGLPYGIEEYTIADSVTHVLEVFTYNAQNEPSYEWEIEDDSIAEIILINAFAHKVVIQRGVETGTTEITVRDIINNHQRVIDLIVE
jgi:VWA domain-containing protein